MSDFLPVADLIARLGLDSSSFTDGLEYARVKLADINPAIITANALIKELANNEKATEEELAGVIIALQEEYELRQQAAVNEKAARAERRAQLKSDTEYEIGLRAEYTAMAKAYAAEEAADVTQSLADQTAARTRYATTWRILLQQQEDAEKAANAATARQIALSPMGIQIAQAQALATAISATGTASEEATGKILVNSFQTRTEAQALNEILGTKIPSSIARMVAFAPQVGAFLTSIFDVVLAAAFIDILYHVGERIQELTRDWEGFDKASIKAWDDAEKGSVRATERLRDYHKMMLEVGEAGLKGTALDKKKAEDKDKEIENIQKSIQATKDEIKAKDQLLIRAKAETEAASDTMKADIITGRIFLPDNLAHPDSALVALKEQGDSLETYQKKVESLRATLEKLGDELAKAQAQRAKDLVKESREVDHFPKRRIPGAEDHEEPYRLPWYLGPDAGQNFLDQMHAGRNVHGLPSRVGGPRSSNEPSGEASGTKVVEVNVTLSPQMVFNGMPADAQRFMREEAYPVLIADLDKNIRGIQTAVREAVEGI